MEGKKVRVVGGPVEGKKNVWMEKKVCVDKWEDVLMERKKMFRRK